jgi:DNA-binding IclR family transcriptional regulator
MLAFGDVELPEDPLAVFTARTIATRKELEAELERVRRSGHAEARDEREEGLSAIAAPVRDSRGDLAGILGVQGPSSRFDRRAVHGAVAELVAHATALSAELGLRTSSG